MERTQPPLLLHTEHILDLYCWIDDVVPKTAAAETGRPLSLTNSEVITLLIWNALILRQKTLKDLHRFALLYHQKDFSIPSYPSFVRLCHQALPAQCALLMSLLDTTAPIRIMDATMLPVCKLARAEHHKTAKDIAKYGKNWQGWHYGFKLHASIAIDGALAGIFFTGANIYDAQAMLKILNKHCKLAVGDTLYGASVMGKKVKKAYGTIIIAPPFPKQNKKIATKWQLELLDMRSKIESVFDYVKEHLHLVSSFPRSVNGYFLQYVRILLGYQTMAWMKRI